MSKGCHLTSQNIQHVDGSVVGFIVIPEHNRDKMPYKNPEETIGHMRLPQ